MKAVHATWLVLAAIFLGACSETEKLPAPSPRSPDEAAAITALKDINQAQANFIRRTRRYAQTLDELIADKLLAAEPKKSDTGYDFLMVPSPDAVSYTLRATPTATGARHFFTDQTGILRAEADKPATASSPEI